MFNFCYRKHESSTSEFEILNPNNCTNASCNVSCTFHVDTKDNILSSNFLSQMGKNVFVPTSDIKCQSNVTSDVAELQDHDGVFISREESDLGIMKLCNDKYNLSKPSVVEKNIEHLDVVSNVRRQQKESDIVVPIGLKNSLHNKNDALLVDYDSKNTCFSLAGTVTETIKPTFFSKQNYFCNLNAFENRHIGEDCGMPMTYDKGNSMFVNYDSLNSTPLICDRDSNAPLICDKENSIPVTCDRNSIPGICDKENDISDNNNNNNNNNNISEICNKGCSMPVTCDKDNSILMNCHKENGMSVTCDKENNIPMNYDKKNSSIYKYFSVLWCKISKKKVCIFLHLLCFLKHLCLLQIVIM